MHVPVRPRNSSDQSVNMRPLTASYDVGTGMLDGSNMCQWILWAAQLDWDLGSWKTGWWPWVYLLHKMNCQWPTLSIWKRRHQSGEGGSFLQLIAKHLEGNFEELARLGIPFPKSLVSESEESWNSAFVTALMRSLQIHFIYFFYSFIASIISISSVWFLWIWLFFSGSSTDRHVKSRSTWRRRKTATTRRVSKND